MTYFILFLEGIITFISPCLLPMLPIYVSYFAGGSAQGKDMKKVIKNALGFILGFTTVFVLLGALAGFFGGLLNRHQTAVNIVTGAIIVLFGLNFLGVFRLNIFKGNNGMKMRSLGFFSSVLFGIVFSVGWTPCVGAFLGSALLMAASEGGLVKGILMLLCYSFGLGIPFLISAILIDKIKGAFQFIKKHYGVINFISGMLLVVVGVLMMTGFFGKFLSLMS